MEKQEEMKGSEQHHVLCPPPPSPVSPAGRQPSPAQPRPPQVDDELEIKAYYAGHVLGAAMFQIRVGAESVVYTVSANAWGTGQAAWAGQEAPSRMLLSLPGRL